MAKVPETQRATTPAFSSIALPPTSRIAASQRSAIDASFAASQAGQAGADRVNEKIFTEMKQLAARETERAQTRQLNEGNAAMTSGFNQIKVNYAERTDHEVFPGEYDRDLLAHQQEVLGGIGDADVQEALKGSSTRALQALSLGAALRAEKQSRVADRTALDSNIAEIVRAFGDADTDEEMRLLKAQGHAAIKRGFTSGVFTEREEFVRAERLFANFEQIEKERETEARRVVAEARAQAARARAAKDRERVKVTREIAAFESIQQGIFKQGLNDDPVAILAEINNPDSEVLDVRGMTVLFRETLRATGITAAEQVTSKALSTADRDLKGAMHTLILDNPRELDRMIEAGEVVFDNPLLLPALRVALEARFKELDREKVELEQLDASGAQARALRGILFDPRATLKELEDPNSVAYAPLHLTAAGIIIWTGLVGQARAEVDKLNAVGKLAKRANLQERADLVTEDTADALLVDISLAQGSGVFGFDAAAPGVLRTRIETRVAKQILERNANRSIDMRVEGIPGSTFNPRDSDNKAALNKRWSHVAEGLAQAEASGNDTLRATYETEAIKLIRVVGYPTNLAAVMDATIMSGGDTKALAGFARIYMGIEALAPGVNKKQFDSKTQMVMRLIGGRIAGGIAPEVAIQESRELVNQSFEMANRRRDILAEHVRTDRPEKFFTGEVEGWFSSLRGIPAPSDSMMVRFLADLKASYMLSGEWKESLAEASSRVRALYSVHTLGGVHRWMRRAPEVEYEETGAPPGWIENQVVENVGVRFAVELDDLPFSVTSQFSDEILNTYRAEGVPASAIRIEEDLASFFQDKPDYVISVMNEHGTFKLLFDPETNLPANWKPEWMSSPDKLAMDIIHEEQVQELSGGIAGSLEEHNRQVEIIAEEPGEKLSAEVGGILQAREAEPHFTHEANRGVLSPDFLSGVQNEQEALALLEDRLRFVLTQEQLDTSTNLAREERGLEPLASLEGTMHWEGP